MGKYYTKEKPILTSINGFASEQNAVITLRKYNQGNINAMAASIEYTNVFQLFHWNGFQLLCNVCECVYYPVFYTVKRFTTIYAMPIIVKRKCSAEINRF